jgi:hypothetical protein
MNGGRKNKLGHKGFGKLRDLAHSKIDIKNWDSSGSDKVQIEGVAMTTIEDLMNYAREAGNMERRMCIGKAQGFDVRNAYNELRAAIEQYAAERVAEMQSDFDRTCLDLQDYADRMTAERDALQAKLEAYEAEAQRLRALLGRIDSIGEQQNG